MASLQKKFIMMGITIIVIPLGKFVLKKLFGKSIDKLEDTPPEEEESQVVRTEELYKAERV